MEEKQKSVIGKVRKVIFRNLKDQFFIISVNITEISFDFKEEEIVITGTMPGLAEGLSYKFSGELTNHPKYGRQFKADSFEPAEEPDDPKAVVKFLVSRQLPGVGEKIAQKIVDKLGVNAVDDIINDPSSLDGFKISLDRKKEIRQKLTEDVELNQVLLAFSRFHISQAAAIDAYNMYGLEAINILNENPYYFLGRVPRLNFNQVDQSCKITGIEVSDEERIIGALKWVATEMINRSGSTLIEVDRILRNTNWVLGENNGVLVDEELVKKCLKENNEDFFSFEGEFVTTFDYARYENEISSTINKLNHPNDANNEVLASQISEFESNADLELDYYQKKAIMNAFKNNLSIITGGPGTGKTTIVRAIIEIFADLHQLDLREQENEEDSGILLTAPTGKASKSLSDKTRFPASTIHRLLKVRDVENRNSETDLISPSLLIVDEMSLVDTGLFAQLLRSLKTLPTVVMLGDVDQLPSVGPGQIFKDLINSDVILTTTLQKNFRQDHGGNIINFASLVNSGEIYDSMEDDYDDLQMISAGSENIVTSLKKIVKKEIDEGTPITELQILAPMYKGKGGIFEINDSIRQLANPQKGKISGFAVGDKVIQLENVPEKDVYNGEIGIVHRVERVKGKLETKVIFDDDHEITYLPDELNQLTLAYAISIHKAQGSEFKTVIVTMNGRFDTMLRRNLLYTAVTRAREHLYLVGDMSTFIRAASLPSIVRKTGLVHKLQRNLDAKYQEEIEEELKKEVIPKIKKVPVQEEKIFNLTPNNYLKIDPMIGMENIKPEDF